MLEEYTDITKFTVVNRYALTLDVNRAPVGAKVSILGRGFTQADAVLVGGMPARTEFQSPTSISFYVPAVAPGQNHPVSLSSGLSVGTLRVDPATVRVVPSSLDLASGASSMLIFSIPSPAPAGGMAIQVTTDVPDSVIMPEVIVPAGDRSVNVSIRGGTPGSGSIYVSAPGQSEIIVPITVR
ncbi:MAG: IPT/TIG domain-containing protein [Opitutaceae bacterium]